MANWYWQLTESNRDKCLGCTVFSHYQYKPGADDRKGHKPVSRKVAERKKNCKYSINAIWELFDSNRNQQNQLHVCKYPNPTGFQAPFKSNSLNLPSLVTETIVSGRFFPTRWWQLQIPIGTYKPEKKNTKPSGKQSHKRQTAAQVWPCSYVTGTQADLGTNVFGPGDPFRVIAMVKGNVTRYLYLLNSILK